MTTTLYRFYDAKDRLLYVGISKAPLARLDQHRHDKPWWTDVARMTLEHHATREAASRAEIAAIRSESPMYNVSGLVPMTPQLRWNWLVAVEPGIQQLVNEIHHLRKAVAADFDPFCAEHAWIGCPGQWTGPRSPRAPTWTPTGIEKELRLADGDLTDGEDDWNAGRRVCIEGWCGGGFKRRLNRLVGWGADCPALRTSALHTFTTRVLFRELPPCRDCSCVETA